MTAGEVESHGGDGEDDRASFNSLIKVEYIHRRRFATRTEARLKIATWITGFYNPRRRHSAAGGLPPEEVERIISEARRTGSESGRSGSAGAAVLVSRAKFVTAVPRHTSIRPRPEFRKIWREFRGGRKMMGCDGATVTKSEGSTYYLIQVLLALYFSGYGPGLACCAEWMGAVDNDQNVCEVSEPVDGWVLSSVQARILEGIAAGFSSGRLSRELYLSSKTIDYHVRAMSDKLQAPNRVSLVSRAFFLQILRTDSWPPRIACETKD